jgi:tRNA(Arg) A34 adenosine deaminase TadA
MPSQRLVDICRGVALTGEGIGRRRSIKHGAILFDKRERVVCAKFNSYKTHPYLARHSLFPHLHAESACILHHGLDNCSRLNILVIRIRRDNSISSSLPCDVCNGLIKEAQIKKCYYSTESGDINVL